MLVFSKVRPLIILLLVGIVFCIFNIVLGRLFRPALDEKSAPDYTSEEIISAEQSRKMELHPDNPPVLVKEVDYRKGRSAAWYPRNESPILAELVKDGLLPPVDERVGHEPIVVEGTEGIGSYGGTWVWAVTSPIEVDFLSFCQLGYQTLVRWSPEGYPIVPHLAKSWEISPDNREYTFHLRKGIKWSDGYPFTSDDIIYWWEDEQMNKKINEYPYPNMIIAGKVATIKKIDDYTVKFIFSVPNGLFLESMAGPWGLINPASCPAHYLRQYHPDLGDNELIEKELKARNLNSRLSLYTEIKSYHNPEHPRLAPWILKTYRSNPPYTFVRNPYYFMVDTKGNQLPYVDRVFFDMKTGGMIPIAAGNGELTMQAVGYRDYTYLMSQRKKGGYDVRHWYSADRSLWFIAPNLNVKVDSDRPETKWQHQLVNDKRFRQALSLAINRKDIIDAEYNGQTKPAQIAPGPESFFYDPESYKLYTEYDPDRASKLLDEIGLTKRDSKGFRTYPDGTRMTFFLPVAYSGSGTSTDATQLVVDDWAKVGINTAIREKSGGLFLEEQLALTNAFTVQGISQVEHMPILEPRLFLPLNEASAQCIGFARWYMNGGLYDLPNSRKPNYIKPPDDHPLLKASWIYEDVLKTRDRNEQKRLFTDVLRIAAENVWTINICTSPPTLYVVKDILRNVPKTAVVTWMFITPGNTGLETYYFSKSHDTAGTIEQIKNEIIQVTPDPRLASGQALKAGIKNTNTASEGLPDTTVSAGAIVGRMIKIIFIGILLAIILLIAFKHPYIGRRLILMIPMLAIISVAIFTIIQLPPGDYISTYIMHLKEGGTEASQQRIQELKKQFYLDAPVPVRYARWMGLKWFITFDDKDKGLLQGNMGRSMETGQSVNDLVGDRLLLTVLISLGTILFTWALAIPIGIYSAVRQYTLSDYILTFIGFVGMCVPGFLLALVLIYLSNELLGIRISGLFSSEFATQAEWNWPKIVNLLQHIWVPILVIGVGGTAGMIRVMRANLLDELKKPYVVTAMAKGVRPLKLLMKYPVRLSLNPFVSGIGGLFPALISGEAIVSIVLNLPTVGPLMLTALMSEDMYLAGSMLMVLSLLSIFGTLISDLLLLWLDPRIRYEGGKR